MKKIIVIVFLSLAAAGAGAWYWLDVRKPPPPPPARSLGQSLKLHQFKSRGYYYLNQGKGEDALMFLKMASELDPGDKALKEIVKELDVASAASKAESSR